MKDTLSFFAFVRDNMISSDCAYVRSMDISGLIAAVLTRMGDDGWTMLERASDVSLKHEDYSAVALDTFGEEYSEYLSTLEICSLDQLRECKTEAEILKALKGYIAGICPAFAYFIEYDQG